MDDLKRSIHEALASEGSIQRQLVRRWIQRADNVEVDALLYKLTEEAWNRIEPNLEFAETCALIERYLLECIRENPEGGVALTRYEAAHELEAWFDRLAEMEDTRENLEGVVGAVTTLFLNGDHDVQRAVETGFLEHVLEQAALRPLFSHWAYDERLQDAWRHALAWGKAHPNSMKDQRAALRAVQSAEE